MALIDFGRGHIFYLNVVEGAPTMVLVDQQRLYLLAIPENHVMQGGVVEYFNYIGFGHFTEPGFKNPNPLISIFGLHVCWF